MPAVLDRGFLVAGPMLMDPNFERTVVLLTAHRPEGSLGFVVNRSAGMSFGDIARELGLGRSGMKVPDLPVLSGGPVAPETGWLVFDPAAGGPEQPDNVLEVSDRLHISTSREMLEAIARRDDVQRHLLVLGYAGWAAGQLEGEIKSGVWIPVDLDERVVFETPLEDRWSAALSMSGIDPRCLVGSSIAEA